MPNLKLTIEYDGTAYHGWQIQPSVPTVQGRLEECLAIVLRGRVTLKGAARTDAGVHALGQVASCETPDVEPRRLARSLNALLPDDIVVRRVDVVHPEFHARHSAVGRIYRYRIVAGEEPSPFIRRFAALSRAALDHEAMGRAAALLVGRRDFSSFCATGDVSESREKEIRRSTVATEGERGELIVYTVEASSFLQYMVRNIAGTLIEVGRGRIHPEEIGRIVEARDRRRAGPTAPAAGLCLLRVLYADVARESDG